MLPPHACHNVETQEVRKGNTNKVIGLTYWCKDCNVKVWHDGSDIKAFFDGKDSSSYNEISCLNFLLEMFKKFPK